MTIYEETYKDIREEARRLIKTFYSPNFNEELWFDELDDIDDYVTRNILRDYNSDTEKYEILREIYNLALQIIVTVKGDFDERTDNALLEAVKDELINMKIKTFNQKIQRIERRLMACNEKIFNLISEKNEYLEEIEKLRGVDKNV